MIVTADDFGIAPEVNEAVERAHTEGILDAASLMVSGAAAADAIARARRLPSLRVGLHLVLVDGPPTLPPARVPDLVDERGQLRSDMARLGCAIAFRPSVREQMRAEIEAQFAAFAATGLRLDHVNAHHHFHVHPVVAEAVVAAVRRHGGAAVRVPQEPAGVLDAVERGSGPRHTWLLQPWIAALRRRVRRAGLVAPDQVFGLAWSGALHEERLCGVLRNLPDGISEVYAHPATRDGYAAATPGYRHAAELAALLSPAVRRLAEAAGARRGGFSDLALP